MAVMNDKALKTLIKKQVYNWFVEIKKNLPKYLEEFIISEYYDQYTPSDLYQRQYRILESITSSDIIDTGDGYHLEIFLDPNKVSYDPSIWGYPNGYGGVSWSYINGDNPEKVFNLMTQGIHGDISIAKTPGKFWNEFLISIGHGGIYDLFLNFQKYMGSKAKITIQ